MKLRLTVLLVVIVALAQAQQQYSSPPPSYVNITTAAVTTVKSSAGALHRFIINTAGANPCKAVLYDSTTNSGTVIGTVDCSSASNGADYEITFQNGLTVDTTGNTNPANLTVTYN